MALSHQLDKFFVLERQDFIDLKEKHVGCYVKRKEETCNGKLPEGASIFGRLRSLDTRPFFLQFV